LRVGDTRIFARRDGARQLLVYSMELSVDSDVAMILPLPVPPSAGEQAVEFVNLERCAAFFDELGGVFAPAGRGLAAAAAGPSTRLAVHAVGQFEASYVPTAADFHRLDPRFRLPEHVWHALPVYADYGFAVFKLRAGQEARIHPMAFRFPTRDDRRLYFPTVHIHEGTFQETAVFDHALYFQRDLPAEYVALRAEEPRYVETRRPWVPPFSDAELAAMQQQARAHARWQDQRRAFQRTFVHEVSERPAAREVSSLMFPANARCASMGLLLEPEWHLFRQVLRGTLPNRDTWIADR
jgi:hypothetical protein